MYSWKVASTVRTPQIYIEPRAQCHLFRRPRVVIMSSAPAESVQSALQAPTTARKKNNNKKKRNKAKCADNVQESKNGSGYAEADDALEVSDEAPGLNGPVEEGPSSGIPEPSATNGHAVEANGHAPTPTTSSPSSPLATDLDSQEDATSTKLAVMTQEREALRAEVEQLRKHLEEMQTTQQQQSPQQPAEHDQDQQSVQSEEMARLRAELAESEAARERAEAQYETLLGRVEKIKATLGDRLKSDKAELEAAQGRIEDLEAAHEALRREARERENETVRLRAECHDQGRELAGLRSRTNLSQQNWLKEKEDLTRQMQHLKRELESTSNAMGEWEVIAMEERSMRESLTEKVAEYEEQVASLRDLYERAAAERDAQSQAVDGLQRALGEIQEARKRELREMVETSEEQLQAMKTRMQEADARAVAAETARERITKELERTVPFEKEVKEKNLLIGKLRHEAIILNDHLTRALKYIKKTKPEDTIDRQIVTNHVLQFLALDRSDPKKFQILQVIAGLLNWTDEQREQAGLARPGTSGYNMRLSPSPFQRTPSSPGLNKDFMSETSSGANKESLASLWAEFLERNVEEAGVLSRKGSMSSVATTTTNRPDTRGGG
ncbi:hypothetical protein P8C59_007260 [Phyllachora maydis]|uniref:GRIP domain-containing protein n=1 Tax=Phyllachora maydis TaxID=1825666 RepID=A0AAD9I8E2_9PEZI|nr:hypothetical protein P8C59_007260 [Phyllachora maydis]